MELTHELRENAGFQWVLERLSPMSPFGKQAARNPRWYGPGDEAALEEELDNVALAMELWAAGGTRPQPVDSCGCEAPRVNPAELKDSAAALRGVTRCLPLFHDIRGSFDRDPGAPFDLVELFELKHFLVTLEQVVQAYAKMPPMSGIAFPSLADALELMDPEGRRLPTFSVVNSYHNDLAPLRAEKAKLEKAIRMTQEDKRGPLLEKRRVLAVEEDKIELEVRQMLTRKLMVWKDAFLANMEALGHLDLIVAKAKLALRYHCVRPALSTDKTISLKGVSHPQVAEELAERGEQFTALELELGPGCTVITGANMGGKTVSLRSTVLSLLPEHLRRRGLFPVGRLDKDTEGLLLLTDDGPLGHDLLAPNKHVDKVYYAQVDGTVDAADAEALARGMVLGDGLACLPAGLEPLGDGSECLVTLREGKYHQVKRMLAARGKPVRYLKRLSMGPIRLDPALGPGEWRPLTREEVAALRRGQ